MKTRTTIFVFTLIQLSLFFGCKDSAVFSGGAGKEGAKKQDIKKPGASESQQTAERNPKPTPTKVGSLPDVAKEKDSAVEKFDPSTLDPKGHNPESDCDICLAKAEHLTKPLGFPAEMKFSINYGPGPAQAEGYPGLCDIHFRSPSGSEEIYFFCPCDCGWPNKKF